jgi:hypothetical protein
MVGVEHWPLDAALPPHFSIREEEHPEGGWVKWEDYKQLETELRELYWKGHGCSIALLYGDDGEMQCNNIDRHRPLDFKRESLDVIKEELMRARIQQSKA